MNKLLRSLFVLAAVSTAGPVILQAAEPDSATRVVEAVAVPAGVPLRRVVPAEPGQAGAPTYELTSSWRAKSQVSTVALANDTDKPLRVIGVQTTSNLFVVDFPQQVRARQADAIAFVYAASVNTDGDTELIRVLTDQGIREIVVKVQREEVAKLDVRELTWLVGERATAKVATLMVTPGTVTPVKVRATGDNAAVLEKLDEGTWRIAVTPGSTLKAGKFAVFVTFDQPPLGQAVVILGEVRPQE
jgi:hypothetical protein